MHVCMHEKQVCCELLWQPVIKHIKCFPSGRSTHNLMYTAPALLFQNPKIKTYIHSKHTYTQTSTQRTCPVSLSKESNRRRLRSITDAWSLPKYLYGAEYACLFIFLAWKKIERLIPWLKCTGLRFFCSVGCQYILFLRWKNDYHFAIESS